MALRLSERLDDYDRGVAAWRDAAKKELAAVQKLEKAVATGNLRDLERLRQAARSASEAAAQRAAECEALPFDAAAYLREAHGFREELREAAKRAGVRLAERDGVIFCYPVLVRPEPELAAVRIDKKLEPNIRPEVLAGTLKKLQSKEPRDKSGQFVETLLEAYQLVRAKRKLHDYVDVPLRALYDIMTLLPGLEREYTLLDFARDVYFLSISDIQETRKGYTVTLTSSTAGRESPRDVIRFVTRDGHDTEFHSIKFKPPQAG